MTGPARNLRVSLLLVLVVVGMVGLSFAAVPLYRVFCAATGYAGTTRRVAEASVTISDRTVAVRFNADVSPELPWRFFPVRREVKVRLGEPTLIYYRAENLAKVPVTGRASFNVVPLVAGQYFNKIQCFCFTEQTLKPGQGVDMAVQFYVDPAMARDPDLKDVDSITLSYSFFRAADDKPANPGASAKLSAVPGERQPGSVN
jgi:cytochrome c oxidase assembly protein subunit 11